MPLIWKESAIFLISCKHDCLIQGLRFPPRSHACDQPSPVCIDSGGLHSDYANDVEVEAANGNGRTDPQQRAQAGTLHFKIDKDDWRTIDRWMDGDADMETTQRDGMQVEQTRGWSGRCVLFFAS
uniref:Uncharacterized protein n=1 Tax=Chromera velia CCMP2878 TaxID=1169474 RepID=A0A0G4H641_9ALVE|mmetsp:Transcript_53456/g.104571  ORF Transcript_53456/g.104571 Transcript_53456/m.104571 type:complete len:125 (-) Transcript_53456:275-649(-)|eukprot:Cvel_24757.t1-p1 / transcript=Cvel_24757.t1 / gene=Cvel_24757 / organism=Chromera_velia_CCMP2878 / gene_product=hypothetical protein / transcript_product=hypothetical protein / location=Cvel_scaffold2721:8852-9824(-) / protein_length=124 / sequence_SO=supercontig / SO=protein_coding / is_pseudo=false